MRWYLKTVIWRTSRHVKTSPATRRLILCAGDTEQNEWVHHVPAVGQFLMALAENPNLEGFYGSFNCQTPAAPFCDFMRSSAKSIYSLSVYFLDADVYTTEERQNITVAIASAPKVDVSNRSCQRRRDNGFFNPLGAETQRFSATRTYFA
jgi:hypothetical protein